MNGRPLRLLAVSSSGGHWSQLMLLREAMAGCDVTFACTLDGAGVPWGIAGVETIPDCNRNTPFALLRQVWLSWRLLRRCRPDAVLSTGALPGLVFIVLGRLTGRRTVWVESMANSEELSQSGRWASRIAHACFVQWQALEQPGRTRFAGALL